MTLVRWQPQRNMLWNVQREIDRIFDDVWSRPVLSRGRDAWVPEVDIEERPDSIVLNLDAPGMDKSALKVTMENNTLTIKGERKFERNEEEGSYHVCERSYGTFQRSFTLPLSVDGGNVRADYRNGVLTVTLPKAEEAKEREIQIDVK
jgi:HSP20 family protein